MRKGDRVSTEQGEGKLWELDYTDGSWLVLMDNGGLLSYFESEIMNLEAWTTDPETLHYITTAQVERSIEFVKQLRGRGDQPGNDMADILDPLVAELFRLRAENSRLLNG